MKKENNPPLPDPRDTGEEKEWDNKSEAEQAEEIAYLFCIIDNPRIENIWNIESDSLRKDLMLLEQANRDEQSEAEMMTWEEAYDV